MRPLGELQIPEPELPPPEVIPVTRLPVVTSPEPPPPEAVAPPPPVAPPAIGPPPVQRTSPVIEEPVEVNADLPDAEPEQPPEEPPEQPPEEPPEQPPEEPPEQPLLEGGTVVPFADDFPHIADVEMGCYGLRSCGQLSNIGNYRRAAQSLIPALEANGYEVDEHITDEPGYSVYTISRPDWRDGEPHYLSIFSDGLGQAVYVITLEVITLDELRQLV